MHRAGWGRSARSGWWHGRRPGIVARVVGLASIGGSLVAASSLAILVPVAQSASADPLSNARAEAAQINSQIQAQSQQLDILSQQYDAAEQQVQQLATQISQTQQQIAATKQRVARDQANLRRQAISAYMDGSDSSLDGVFVAGGTQSAIANEYRNVAAGNVSEAIDSLHQAQATLSAQETTLQSTESQAQAAASQASAARQSAQATEQHEQQTLNQVKGQIATLVAQQQAAEQAAQQRAFEQRVAAQAAAAKAAASAQGTVRSPSSSPGAAPPLSSGPAPPSNVPVAPGGAGAVQAAQSQLGVPYVWGAEEPGVGFDCSGLTQWAWGQAGVGIPRTAQAQYDAIVHVSLSALQPGDLLFWNDGTSSIQHVAMYVGGGTVIQAPETGETVSYAGIWNNGLVGAGRP